uniref:Uncharacterized protein n=1 Tax=Magallana gigas TaxID=29159 RepID=K1R2V8_MAGGI
MAEFTILLFLFLAVQFICEGPDQETHRKRATLEARVPDGPKLIFHYTIVKILDSFSGEQFIGTNQQKVPKLRLVDKYKHLSTGSLRIGKN